MVETMIPRTDASIDETEGKLLAQWCREMGVRTVLEFGPGYSTNFFLQAGCKVTCAESDEKWIERFKQFPESNDVFLVKFNADELPIDLRHHIHYYDLAFIDSPKGNVFPASRINTALYAWHRCGLIAIHDTKRPGERLTVRILQALGCQIIAEPNESVRGLTLLKVRV